MRRISVRVSDVHSFWTCSLATRNLLPHWTSPSSMSTITPVNSWTFRRRSLSRNRSRSAIDFPSLVPSTTIQVTTDACPFNCWITPSISNWTWSFSRPMNTRSTASSNAHSTERWRRAMNWPSKDVITDNRWAKSIERRSPCGFSTRTTTHRNSTKRSIPSKYVQKMWVMDEAWFSLF